MPSHTSPDCFCYKSQVKSNKSTAAFVDHAHTLLVSRAMASHSEESPAAEEVHFRRHLVPLFDDGNDPLAEDEDADANEGEIDKPTRSFYSARLHDDGSAAVVVLRPPPVLRQGLPWCLIAGNPVLDPRDARRESTVLESVETRARIDVLRAAGVARGRPAMREPPSRKPPLPSEEEKAAEAAEADEV